MEKRGRPPKDDGTTVLRFCRRHGQAPHRPFRDGEGFRYRCRQCVAEWVTRRHRKMRRMLVAEAGGRCAVCGYDRCIGNLHFHHVDPRTKVLEMTVASGKGIDRYREEARKCVLVCANCHGEIESGLIPSPPPGATYTGSPARMV